MIDYSPRRSRRRRRVRVSGKDMTPFLLDYVHSHTEGASLDVNLEIVLGNCRLAAEIASAYARVR